MSLLSTERYIAILGCEGVGLCRCSRDGLVWLGRADSREGEQTGWLAAMEGLERLFDQVSSGGRAKLYVLVSNHFSRYCLLPWSEQIDSPTELQNYAGICFEEIYGSLDNEWHFRFSPEAGGRARLAAAMPVALITCLQQSASSRGWQLESIQPYLMAAFNRFSKMLPEDDFLFLLAEPRRSTLLLARGGQWAYVRSLSSDDSDPSLGVLIEREVELQQLDGMPAAQVYLHAPGRVDTPPSPVCAVTTHALALPRPEVGGDYLYTMAMAVL